MSLDGFWWNSRKPSDSNKSNLENFLDSVTPFICTESNFEIKIPALNSLQKPLERENIIADCFILSDLWEAYMEWSAYGAGFPFILDCGNTVMQFYSPTLSAIQIYTNKPYASLSEEKSKLSINKGSSTSCHASAKLDTAQQTTDQLGYLYLEYSETSIPYDRPPLFTKIMELAEVNPGLMSLKSIDLSPYSWVAVAWYPIYQIPPLRNVRELSTSFLTYHMLSRSGFFTRGGPFARNN